jgi:hypothetical protein
VDVRGCPWSVTLRVTLQTGVLRATQQGCEPRNQAAVAARRGLEGLDAEDTSVGVDGGSDMELGVGVDTASDGDRGVLDHGHGHPFQSS